METSYGKGFLVLMGVALIVIVAVFVLNMPDHRSTGERLGDAAQALPHGVGKAADQLGDRTPLQKAGDAVSKSGDELKKK